MIISRFMPLIIPALVLSLLEAIYFYPKSLYVMMALVLAVLLYATYVLKRISKIKDKWYNYLILPLYLCTATVLISIILPVKTPLGQLSVQSLFFLATVLLYYYYSLIYSHVLGAGIYGKNSLAFFSAYTNFITVYFVGSSAFGFQSFLGASIWLVLLVLLVFVALTSYEQMWANGVSGPLSGFYILLICLAIFELSWAVSFLSLSYYILGLLIAIAYYITAGLVRFKTLKILNNNIIKTYLLLGLVSLVVVLMTARWI